MRPYIKKDLNFQMFIDILMDKVDLLRTNISLKDIVNIEYGLFGLPHIVVKLFSVLA